MITLILATCSLLAGDAPANPEEQLIAIAATQEQTAKAYARLSYDAVMTFTGFDSDRNGECKYEIRSRSNTVMATRIAPPLVVQGEGSGEEGKPDATVENKPHIVKALKTPEYIAFWPGVVEPPQIFVHFLQDWEDAQAQVQVQVQNYDGDFGFASGDVEIQNTCLGMSEPFYESYKRKIHEPRWHVSQPAGSRDFIIQRELRDRDLNYRVDLTQSIDQEDGLLSHAEFRPKNSVIVYQVEYDTMQQGGTALRVPSHCVRLSEDTRAPETKHETTIKYSNLVDEFDLPPLTLADMGVPSKAEIIRHWPDAGKPSQRLPWDGRDLTYRPRKRTQ